MMKNYAIILLQQLTSCKEIDIIVRIGIQEIIDEIVLFCWKVAMNLEYFNISIHNYCIHVSFEIKTKRVRGQLEDIYCVCFKIKSQYIRREGRLGEGGLD
jgi:hypothetical protein